MPRRPKNNGGTTKKPGGVTGRGFKPGRSGNPKGRPKVPEEVRELARAHTVDAIEGLSKVLRAKKTPAMARIVAAEALLNRGWGKPRQELELSGPGGKPLIPTIPLKDLSDGTLAQLEAALAAAEAEAGKATGDDPAGTAAPEAGGAPEPD
jgi:hypothetical protein